MYHPVHMGPCFPPQSRDALDQIWAMVITLVVLVGIMFIWMSWIVCVLKSIKKQGNESAPQNVKKADGTETI